MANCAGYQASVYANTWRGPNTAPYMISNTFLGNIAKRPGAVKCRKRFYEDLTSATVVQAMVIYPPGADPAMPIRELTEAAVEFAGSRNAWRDGRSYLRAAA